MLHEMVVLSAGLPTSRDRKMFNALAIGMCNGWSMGLSNALNFSSCLNFLFLLVFLKVGFQVFGGDGSTD